MYTKTRSTLQKYQIANPNTFIYDYDRSKLMIDKEYGEIAKDTWNSESSWKKPQTDDKKQNGTLGINTLKNGEWDSAHITKNEPKLWKPKTFVSRINEFMDKIGYKIDSNDRKTRKSIDEWIIKNTSDITFLQEYEYVNEDIIEDKCVI